MNIRERIGATQRGRESSDDKLTLERPNFSDEKLAAISNLTFPKTFSKFLSSVKDAPNEVIKLYQTLDQLNSTLKQVSYLLEQQYGDS